MIKHRSKVVQAVLGLIERDGRYLICQRRAGDFLGGFWEFPGGKREPGESWQICLRRELREELGVSVRALKPFGAMRYRYGARMVVFNVFRCVIARGRPKPKDAQRLRWVRAEQLQRYRFPPANRRLIAALGRAQHAFR